MIDTVLVQVGSSLGVATIAAIGHLPARIATVAVLMAAGICWLWYQRSRWGMGGGFALILAALVVLADTAPPFGGAVQRTVFWILAGCAVIASVAAITVRNPVHSAIWFAGSVIGVAGLFFFQGGQFLAVATVAVYAGAIVVMFLFVLMLAQPGGRAFYDRISWARFSVPFTAGTAMALFGLVAAAIFQLDDRYAGSLRPKVQARIDRWLSQAGMDGSGRYKIYSILGPWQQWGQPTVYVHIEADPPVREVIERHEKVEWLARATAEQGPDSWQDPLVDFRFDDVQTTQHVAALGRQVFGRHLIAVEVAGVLLLIALVGAIAMTSRGVIKEDG